MEKPGFYCEFCGAPVPRDASSCPSCGRFFDAVKCPSCGFEGEAVLFREGCPSCGYAGSGGGGEENLRDAPAESIRRRRLRSYRPVIVLLLVVLAVLVGLLVRRI